MTRTEYAIRKVLRDLGLVGNNTPIEIIRTRAKRHLLAAGAWSWFAIDGRTKLELCGSCYTCKEIVESHKKGFVVVYKNELIVERDAVR